MSLASTIQVQCIYGEEHVPHILRVIIPALAASTRRSVVLASMNYDGSSQIRLSSGSFNGITIVDIENHASGPIGFAESHNTVFKATQPSEPFILLNPDCIPQEGSIDLLIARKAASKSKVGIVEGRQWPFEHPKEYDPLSLETPWASGAFCLVDAEFYRSINGMDEIYHLYLEDVDLSWQAWLHGYKVVYEPAAAVAHFTGFKFYRDDLISNEEYYSIRNFIIISRKFFGEQGESESIRLLQSHPSRHIVERSIEDYKNLKPLIRNDYVGRSHPKIKILGINCFHKLR